MKRILLLILVLLCPVLTVSAQPDSARQGENIFGVIEAFWLPEAACELGAGWERIIFDWAQHQPTGIDDWNTLNVDERWLREAQACDREVVAIVKATPAWATDGTPLIGVPRGLYLEVDDPGNLWARFIRRAAEYYAERGVRRFIIWNEPDISEDTYGYEFEGTLADYARLLEVAWRAARQGNPDAIIHMAGTTYWHDVNARQRLYVDRLLEHLSADPEAAANGYYFDVLTLHIYFRSETVYTIVREMQALLEQYGIPDKQIWITETNASPNLDPAWPVTRPNWQVTLEQQAAFLIHAAALGLAAGADSIGVYKFYDWNLPPGAEAFGLIRVDETRRPAFDTWRFVIREFNGVIDADYAQTDTVDVVRLQRADGMAMIVAWARTAAGGQIRISPTDQGAQIADLYGTMMNIAPWNDAYTLALPGARCNPRDGCAVGGAPVILMQPEASFAVEVISSAGSTVLNFDEAEGL